MTDVAAAVEVGERLPDLRLVDASGVTATLHDVRAGRPAVVYFMRASTCPVCHRHLAVLVDLAEGGALGDSAVLVLTPGDTGDVAGVRRRAPSGAVDVRATGEGHAEVGLGRFLALQHSGTFLLDAAGTVTYRRTAAVPLQSFDRSELLDALPRRE